VTGFTRIFGSYVLDSDHLHPNEVIASCHVNGRAEPHSTSQRHCDLSNVMLFITKKKIQSHKNLGFTWQITPVKEMRVWLKMSMR